MDFVVNGYVSISEFGGEKCIVAVVILWFSIGSCVDKLHEKCMENVGGFVVCSLGKLCK